MNSIEKAAEYAEIVNSEKYRNALNADFERFQDFEDVFSDISTRMDDFLLRIIFEEGDERDNAIKEVELFSVRIGRKKKNSHLRRWFLNHFAEDFERVRGGGNKKNSKVIPTESSFSVQGKLNTIKESLEGTNESVGDIVAAIERIGDLIGFCPNDREEKAMLAQFIYGLVNHIRDETVTINQVVRILSSFQNFDATVIAPDVFSILGKHLSQIDEPYTQEAAKRVRQGLRKFTADDVPQRFLILNSQKSRSKQYQSIQGTGSVTHLFTDKRCA